VHSYVQRLITPTKLTISS